MCLKYKVTKEEKKKLIDNVPKEGMKVYKVVFQLTDEAAKEQSIQENGYFSPYTQFAMSEMITVDKSGNRRTKGYEDGKEVRIRVPYKAGVDEATHYTKDLVVHNEGKNFKYKSGFHFFKTKAAATRLKKLIEKRIVVKGERRFRYKVIECIVKKSWITEVGLELAINKDNNGLESDKTEVVIVAKKAIFPAVKRKV